jgi:long-chain acyl-CoA synthetase
MRLSNTSLRMAILYSYSSPLPGIQKTNLKSGISASICVQIDIIRVRPHLASLVEDLRRHRHQTAIVQHRGNRSYPTTYAALANLAGRFACEFDRRAIAPGDRVILWGENSAAWIAAFFGCLLRGVLVVPLDAAGSPAFAQRVIADTTPRLIVADTALLGTLTNAPPSLTFSDLEMNLPTQPNFEVSPAVTLDAPFQIIFTSGTTAEPKGIVHTHRNVLSSLSSIEHEMQRYLKYERLFHPLRFLHALPLSHVFGQFMGLWTPALLAAEVHFDTQLEPARMIDTIRTERISVLIAVPRVLDLLRTHLLGRYPSLTADLSAAQNLPAWKRWWKLRHIHSAFGLKFWALICGGASLPADLERFWNTLGFALIQGYGMTETAALITLNHPFHIGRGSIGKVLPGREVQLRNSEIFVRGDILSPATWQSGRLEPRAEEWLATGDLAERDAAGELRFVGRKGDVIVSPSGMNIYPADLEAAILQQPGVRGCVVVPCEISGTVEPVAVVLFASTRGSSPAESASDAELHTTIANANRHLVPYQQVRRFLRWPEATFPFTTTGKLLRRSVGQWASETLTPKRGASQAPPKDFLLQIIAAITHESVAESIAASDDTQRLSEDLHIDSLGRVQLQSELEQRLGIELPDEASAKVETLGQLRALVSSLLSRTTTAPPESASPAGQPEAAAAAAPAPSERDASVPDAFVPPAFVSPAIAPEPSTEQPTYPRWPWTPPIQLLRNAFLELIARPLTWLLAAPKVIRDTPDLPPGPYLIIANHVTAYDGALVHYALPPKLRRRLAAAMAADMLRDYRHGRNQGNWLLNLVAPAEYWLLTALYNVFPLPRDQGFRKSFSHAGRALDRGYSVLIFPEGRRSKDGRLQPFRPGIGLLTQDSRVPILPVALIGLGEMRTNRRWFRSGQLTIHVGTPIPYEENADPAEITRKLFSVLSCQIIPRQSLAPST